MILSSILVILVAEKKNHFKTENNIAMLTDSVGQVFGKHSVRMVEDKMHLN